jgi:hypothetical protein
LGPLGLVQKGRSRTWLDDNEWWLAIVEFQPSSFSRGSYLNVGAMWLWRPDDDPFLFYAVGGRVAEFVAFESEKDFAPKARRLAVRAAQEVEKLRAVFPDVAGAAAYLVTEVDKDPDEKNPEEAFDAAVASGLADDAERARSLFDLHDALSRRYHERDRNEDWYTEELSEQHDRALARSEAFRLRLDDTSEFRREVFGVIDRVREALGLPRLD